MELLDVHVVHTGLLVGANPTAGREADWMREYRSSILPEPWGQNAPSLTHIVFCASQYQPPARAFPDQVSVYCPLEDIDAIPSRATITAVMLAATAAAEAWKGDGKVLFVCQAGINRSALVAAMTMQLLGVAPHEAVDAIRRRRHPYCLSNESFERLALRRQLGIDHYFKDMPGRTA